MKPGSATRRGMLYGMLAAHLLPLNTQATAYRLRRGKPNDYPAWVANSVKIGVIQPLNGPLAPLGRRSAAAIHNAVEWINLKGGIASLDDKPLFAIEIDIMAYPGGAAETVAAAQEAGVSVLIGSSTSPLSKSVAQAAAETNLPFLVDGAIGDITSEDTPTTFRFGPGLTSYVDHLLAVILELAELEGFTPTIPGASESETPVTQASELNKPAEVSGPRLALITGIGGFARMIERELTARLLELGIRLEPMVISDPTLVTAEKIVADTAELDPDWLLVVAFADLFEGVMQALSTSDWRPKAMLSLLGAFSTSEVNLTRFKGKLDGWIDVSVWPDHSLEGTELFLRRFRAAEIPVTVDTVLAHESVMLFKDICEQAASTDREALLETLSSSVFESQIIPFETTSFLAGQNQKARPFTLQLKDNKLWHVADPSDLVYPLKI